MKTQQALIVCIVMMTILSGLVAYKKMVVSSNNPVVERPVTPERPEEPEKPEKPKYTIEDALASIKADELRNHVVWLSSDEREGRMSGEPGGDAARDYIKKELESYGYQTMMDEFRVSKGDGTAENVYAWIEGVQFPQEVIVVGAHYDHIGKGRSGVYNGADDNASGTAAVLEMAKALAPMKDKVKRTIVFQLYSGEELGLIGSTHYVSNPKFPLDGPSISKHIFMENLDMIGYSQYDPRIFQIVDKSPIGAIVQLMTEKYPFAARVTKYGASGGASDHAPFTRMKVPATFLHTGTHPYYHKTTDDAERLNYMGMEFITKYGLDFLWYVSENGLQIKVADLDKEADKMWEALDHGTYPFIK